MMASGTISGEDGALRVLAYLGGRRVPLSVFLSMKFRGSSIFSSLPFLLMGPNAQVFVQIENKQKEF